MRSLIAVEEGLTGKAFGCWGPDRLEYATNQ